MLKFNVTSYSGWNEPGQGQHSTELIFVVKGEEGAMVWRLATGISPAGHYGSMYENGPLLEKANISYPMSMGVTAHSELSLRNADAAENLFGTACEFLDGRDCVCDYSRALTSEYTQAFACEGFEGVRKLLEEEYKTFYGKDS